ncbi:MAG: flagellar filament capping protein FliD, partial [Pseudomonadota bacterium]
VAAIEERMSAFVDAFNGVKVLADELTDFDTESQQGALLTGDATLRSISSQLRRFLAAPIDGLEDSGFRSLVDVGLTTNQDLGFILSFDAAQFTRLLQEDTRGLTTLLTDDVRATDSQLEVRSFSDATAAGTYAVEITQVATNGRNTGAALASLSGATVIDANNDSLRVSIDGVASEEIVLTAGTYADSDALAVELERQINADRLLRDADRSVDVVFDSASEQLLILSNRFGSGSTVAIDAVDSSTAATLGFSESDGVEEAGLDVAGLVDGVPGQGSGQFLQVPLGPAPASGARLDGTEISFPLTVVAAADTFSLTVDGTNTGTLTVPAATYNSGAELAAAITTAVNDSAPITASGQTIEARFDPSAGRLVLASTTTGQSSTLRLEAIDETLAGQLGLTVGAESIGTNAGRQDSAVGGLQIRVTGGDVGARGEVSVIRGAMNGLDRFLDTLLSSSGALRTRVDGLEERLADIDTEAVDFDERMDALEERLRFQFAAADALISQLNNTSSFLEQQLASLPGVSRDES